MDFDALLSGLDPDIAELAGATRGLVRAVAPTAREEVQPAWGGYLLFKTGAVTVCYLSAHRNHVSLGFSRGLALPDPEGLLEGTGKNSRHLKLRSARDLERPAVRDLVEAAWRGQPSAEELRDSLERVRALCLAFPETSETRSHGHPTFWAGRRTFAVFGLDSPSVAFKAGLDLHAELEGDPRITPTPYLHRSGWLSLALDQETDWDEVRHLLEHSYLQVATTRLRARLARPGP